MSHRQAPDGFSFEHGYNPRLECRYENHHGAFWRGQDVWVDCLHTEFIILGTGNYRVSAHGRFRCIGGLKLLLTPR